MYKLTLPKRNLLNVHLPKMHFYRMCKFSVAKMRILQTKQTVLSEIASFLNTQKFDASSKKVVFLHTKA